MTVRAALATIGLAVVTAVTLMALIYVVSGGMKTMGSFGG